MCPDLKTKNKKTNMLALNRLFRQNICSFCWRCCSDSVGPHECFLWTYPHRGFGRTRLVSYSSSFPIFSLLCLHISPPIRALAVWRARRTAWTWRCLGSVTHDARIETSFCRRTHWGWSGHIIKLRGKSIFGKLLKGFFFFFPDPFSDESQTVSSQRR